MIKLIEKFDKLSDNEVAQLVVGAIVAGIGLGLIVNAIINPMPFEL